MITMDVIIVTVIDPNSISPILYGERTGREAWLQCLDKKVLCPRYGNRVAELNRRVVQESLSIALYATVFGFYKIGDLGAQSFEPLDRHRDDGVRFKSQVPCVNQIRRTPGIKNKDNRVVIPIALSVQSVPRNPEVGLRRFR